MDRAPGEWLYRALLRAYPKDFRRRFGAEALRAFHELWAEPEYRGPGGAVRFWKHVLGDFAGSVLRARGNARSDRARGGGEGKRGGIGRSAATTGRWEVMVDGTQCHIIRRRETVSDLMQGETLLP